jgi:hypothetical protein
MCIDVRIIAIFKTSRVDHISTRKYSCRSIFIPYEESRTEFACTLSRYFTLFSFRKSNIRTVSGFEPRRIFVFQYNSNSVPHLVFRTYQIYLSPASTGKNSWVLHMICHRNILPFVVLSASIPFEIAWYS